MARGGVVAGGIVVVAAAAVTWWMFAASPASVPVVESEVADESSTGATTRVDLAAGRRPGAVVTDAAPAGYVATIRGRVTGPQGAPVPDVLVLLRVQGGFDDRGAVDPAQRGKAETERTQRWLTALDAPTVDDDVGALRVTTGADGRFTVAVDRWGNWSAEARPAPPLCGGAASCRWLARRRRE